MQRHQQQKPGWLKLARMCEEDLLTERSGIVRCRCDLRADLYNKRGAKVRRLAIHMHAEA